MKDRIILLFILIYIFVHPIQLYGREAEFYDDKNSYIPYNNPKPTSIYDDSKTKTEAIYKNIFDKVLRFNSDITITPSVVNRQNMTGNTGNTNMISSNYSPYSNIYDLPMPKAQDEGGIRGYITLLNQIKNNPKALWATRQLLEQEKNLMGKNNNQLSIHQYYTTAWIWFENGSSKWPDLYLQNCNDSYGSHSISYFCPPTYKNSVGKTRNSLLQIGGYQLQNKINSNNFKTIFETCMSDDQVQKKMQEVLDNSKNASRDDWNYKAVKHQGFVNANFNDGSISAWRLSDIPFTSAMSDPTAQARTALLGKHPCMVIGLNSYSINESFLNKMGKVSDNNKLYGYIGTREAQVYANIAAALALFDSGQDAFTPNKQPIYTGYLSSELTFAQQVVDMIYASCNGGYINKGNANCLDALGSILKSATIERFKSSAKTYKTLQCVGCADAMAFERGRPLSDGAGAAKLYLNLNLNGYRKVLKTGDYKQQIVPGALFITNAGTFGHIGYVVEVAPDKSWFRVFECNAPGDGYVRLQIWDMSSPVGWQVPI